MWRIKNRAPRNPLCRKCVYFGLSVAILSFGMGNAQTTKVVIDTSREINILTNNSLGVPAVMHSGDAFSMTTVPYLRVIGATTLRYPGNRGVADIYHWESRSVTSYKGSDKPYLAPESDFGSFARMVDKLGSAIVIVNYGSNSQGDDGGQPVEAAAWVAYANGDPGDMRSLGKDVRGTDWKTIGFWAGLRAGDHLGIDDGYNFLRIGHATSLNIKLWQIGDQVYNNGFYGAAHASNPDLHGSLPDSSKDLSKLAKDPKLSASVFGANVLDFAKAMKAVDPSIQVGVGLPTPPDGDKTYPDFSVSVLKKACSALDFIALDWAPIALSPPNYKTLDDAQTFAVSKDQLGAMLTDALAKYKDACPKGHTPRITFASAGVPSWAKPEHPVFAALWIADIYSMLIESGSENVTWLEMYGSSMISTDRKTFGPAYYGMQMIHAAAHTPGDSFVSTASTNPRLSVHATKRRDGMIGLMLINEDDAAITAQLSINGTNLAAEGRRLEYGMTQASAGSAVATSSVSGLGKNFNVTVPGYTVVVLLAPLAK